MKFSRPEMLYLLWLTPLLAAICLYGFRRRRRILESFATQATRSALTPAVSQKRRGLKAVLVLLAFPLLAVGLAGVQYGYSWQTVERQGVSLMLALDCSKSMLATDVAPNRLERAKRKIRDLVGMLKGDKVGLVAFAGAAFLQCPLTLDYAGFDLFLSALHPEDMPAPGTDLAAAVRVGLAGFDQKDGSERAILLITDGESVSADAIKAAEEAAAQKVRIFCVGVGSPEGAPVPDGKGGFKKDAAGALVHSKLDEDTLQKMAALTGGAYVRSVAGDFDLETIYGKEIRSAMEAKTLSSGRKQLFKDRFRWFLGLALALLFADLLIPAAKRVKGKGPRFWSLTLCALAGGLALVWSIPAQAATAAGLAEEGLAAYEKQDYEAALKHFLDAQIKNPDDPVLAYDAGNAYYRQNKYEDARKNYLAALQALEKQGKAAPAALAALKPKALYNLGNAEFRLDHLSEAVRSYEQTLKLDPKDEDAKKNLEYVKKLLEERKEPEQKQQEQPPQENKCEEKQQKPSDEQQSQKQEKQDDKQGDKKQDQGAQSQQADKDASAGDGKKDTAQGEGQQKFESSVDASELPPQAPERPDKDQDQAAQQSPAETGKPQNASPNMDQNILNRLKDKPGMAAMPKYQPRKVDKDW